MVYFLIGGYWFIIVLLLLERMWRKGRLLALLVGMEIDTATRENTMAISSEKNKKTRNKPPYDQTVPLLGTQPEKSKIERHMHQCSSKHHL